MQPALIKEQDIRTTFGHNLKEILHNSYISQKQLAEMVGTSPLVVHRWVHGYSIPQPRMLAEICNALFIRPADLMREQAS